LEAAGAGSSFVLVLIGVGAHLSSGVESCVGLLVFELDYFFVTKLKLCAWSFIVTIEFFGFDANIAKVYQHLC
jgi:hypothetical protein